MAQSEGSGIADGVRQANPRARLSVARLLAVQALFQMEAGGTSLDRTREDFADRDFAGVVEGSRLIEPDPFHFDRLLSTAVDEQPQIDRATDGALSENWPIDRIDPVLRAVFRAAGAELVGTATPTRVIISEFVDVAKAFLPDSPAAGFVNAVLDHMARKLRLPVSAGLPKSGRSPGDGKGSGSVEPAE